ncbi:hypothetical protein HETIRDRAFT_461148 [Heterobasidion irregulare TC 32-1]|uniref:Uncharacterized protein n=1 Tax=Heterobasidion irregulare (strain TC 32-1) TaxID=747525 RepID=W4JRH2_HETIT|nr:uncharacterized protein HETIRDRAFT_461148 [Heterobasidion irregulare TC 32-1]ETW76172.1 hypothetical protein HETIRDRAFT_461148 [Heterobasidion irregulare TC 32-1]
MSCRLRATESESATVAGPGDIVVSTPLSTSPDPTTIADISETGPSNRDEYHTGRRPLSDGGYSGDGA